MRLFSPAKINLFFRVLGKQREGFHEIASLMQAVSMGDFLTFSFSDQDRLTSSDPTLPCDHRNLVSRAVSLFRKQSALSFHINIHIEKNIPVEAGLGGGSSNAATTLWALNALHGFPYSELELQEWSGLIGSDIPFFFSHGTAIATGRGEKIQELPTPPFSEPLSIFKPSFGLSTPTVFKALRLDLCSRLSPEELLASHYEGTPIFLNDLEPPALSLLPALTAYKQQLMQRGYANSVMTGSGTAFFAYDQKGGRHMISRSPYQWWTLKK